MHEREQCYSGEDISIWIANYQTSSLFKAKRVDWVLSVQLLKSGTSIGANAEEAMGGSSKKDFKQKLRIAYREARETGYWLRLLRESELLEVKLADSMLADCTEIIRILTAILNATPD